MHSIRNDGVFFDITVYFDYTYRSYIYCFHPYTMYRIIAIMAGVILSLNIASAADGWGNYGTQPDEVLDRVV